MTREQIENAICTESINLEQINAIIEEAVRTLTNTLPEEIRARQAVLNSLNMLCAAARLADRGRDNISELELAVHELDTKAS